jgi:hypothetical protein
MTLGTPPHFACSESLRCFLANFEPHIADLAHSVLTLLMLTYLQAAIVDLYVQNSGYFGEVCGPSLR